MADRKPTGFRFRLPWLLQPAPTPASEPPTQKPRASPQTSVASTSAQRPPFRPPGRAPAPAATPAPTSPAQARPQPVASPPTPPPVPAKSPVPKSSPIAKTVEPEATQPNKETKTTTESIPVIETTGPTTPPQRSAVRSPREAQSLPSPPQSLSPPNPDSQSSSPSRTPPRAKSPSLSPSRMATEPQPSSPSRSPPQAKSQPLSPSRMAAQSQPGPQTPPPPKPDSQLSSPLRIRTPRQANYQPSSPSRMASQQLVSPPQSPQPTKPDSQPSSPSSISSEPSSPSRMASKPQVSPPQSPQPTKPDSQPSSPSSISTSPEANSKPSSPSRMAIQPHVPTKPSSPVHEAIRSPVTTHPLSPIHAQPSQARTPPRSPPRSPSRPTNKTSLSPPHAKTISSPIPDDAPEIKQSTKITQKYNPLDSNYVPQSHDLSHHAKPTKTRSMNTHSMETKPTTTAARVPLHREIKGDISKFIHNIMSTHAQSKDDKHASVITLAGDNTGASMNLSSDAPKRGNNLTTDKTEHDAINNADQETKAIVNSNIQGINNSMVFNSSVTERNPGVHLRITCDLANTNDSKMKSPESMEMQRAEVNVSPPNHLVYDPTTVESLEEVYMDPKEFEQGDHARSANEIEVL